MPDCLLNVSLSKKAVIFAVSSAFDRRASSINARSLDGAISAAWLAQLGERRSAEWEAVGSNPGRTNTQGL